MTTEVPVTGKTGPPLDDFNYHDWSYRFWAQARAKGCEDIITGKEEELTTGHNSKLWMSWLQRNKVASADIIAVVTDSQHIHLCSHEDSAYDMWASLKLYHESGSVSSDVMSVWNELASYTDFQIPLETHLGMIAKIAGRLADIFSDPLGLLPDLGNLLPHLMPIYKLQFLLTPVQFLLFQRSFLQVQSSNPRSQTLITADGPKWMSLQSVTNNQFMSCTIPIDKCRAQPLAELDKSLQLTLLDFPVEFSFLVGFKRESAALTQNSILARHSPPFSASPDSVAFFTLQVLNTVVQLDMFDNMPIYDQPFTLGMRKHVSDAIDSVIDLLHHQGLQEALPHIFGYFQQASLLPPGSHYAYFIDLHNKCQEAQHLESPCYIPQSPVLPDYSPSSTGATLGYANEPILGLSMLPATPPSSPDHQTGLSIAQLGYTESALGANLSHESPLLSLDAHVAHAVQYVEYEDIKGFVNENEGFLSFSNLCSPALSFWADGFMSFSDSSSITLPELETVPSSPVSHSLSEWDLSHPPSLESCSNMQLTSIISPIELGFNSENKTSYL
ncbi:hypothetical protein C8J56DRAFT_899208 [Mycena floridula]|nr:hypothetical protein C8J56DRAFT_899208 [Mycena floridula]